MKSTFRWLLGILFLMQFATAQILPSTAKSIPVMYKINLQNPSANNVWNTNLRTMPHKPKTILGNSENVKLRNKIEKLNNAMVQTSAAYKTTGATPTIGSSFKGNDLSTNTPSDNSIAIGNDGKIVVVNNFSIAVYDSAGNTLITPNTWTGILNPFSPALLRGKFDPRVLYDPYHDRYIFCILHAPVDPANSSFILGFSQSNDPTQGWNIYNLSGNPLSNGAWTDYPNMGINEYELFINANLFGTAATNYKFF